MTGWLGDWVAGWLLGCLAAWLLGWLLGCLVAWLLGCLVGWLVGWLLAVVGAAGIEMVSHIRGRRQYRDGFAHLGAAGIEMVSTEEVRQKTTEQGLRFLHQVAIQNLLKNCPGKILPNFGARPNCKIFVQIIHKWAKLLGKISIRDFL